MSHCHSVSHLFSVRWSTFLTSYFVNHFSNVNEVEDNNSSLEAGLRYAEAQKLCKYASANAMTHEGIPAAMDDLEKAMRLLYSRLYSGITLHFLISETI